MTYTPFYFIRTIFIRTLRLRFTPKFKNMYGLKLEHSQAQPHCTYSYKKRVYLEIFCRWRVPVKRLQFTYIRSLGLLTFSSRRSFFVSRGRRSRSSHEKDQRRSLHFTKLTSLKLARNKLESLLVG